MFKNNLLVAWRNLLRNKLQTSINILGLAIGIAGCLTVFLLVNFELGFNKNIVDGDRIYRVYTEFNGQFSGLNAGVPTGMPPLAASSLQGTEVQSVLHTHSAKVAVPNERQPNIVKDFERQKDLLVIEPEYFDLIQNYEWLSGSPRQSLSEPFQVVLTESKAKLYFGMKDVQEAIGRELIYSDSLRMIVSGILKDPEFSSDFYFNDFLSAQTIEASFLKENIPVGNWNSVRSGDQLFVKAAKGISMADLSKQLKPLNERLNAEFDNVEIVDKFKLQPLADLHFNNELGIFDDSRNPAHKNTLYGLILIAGLLLLIAAINFINLATVQATRRSKETGVRKVIGASRGQLARQFLVETAVIALLALPVAGALSELAIRYFSEFLPPELSINVFSPGVLLFLLGSVAAVTFLAGLYPSFVMSSFNPAFAIKNQTASLIGKQSSGLRKGLIIFQFVLAQAFIIGAMVMGNQLKYVLHKDLGFDKDAVVYFYLNWGSKKEKKRVFQKQLEQLPEVKATALQNKPPIERGYQTTIFTYQKNGEAVDDEVHLRMVDTAYLNLYNIELLAGRNHFPSDTTREFVINETLSKDMGFGSPMEAIGATINYSEKEVPIVGVVKDFHVRSLHHAIPPLALTGSVSSAYCVSAKVSKAQPLAASLDKFKAVWQDVFPGADFNYYVLNDTFERLYEAESHTAKLINTATGLAIFISCLGLFGLTFFTVTHRSKEISIRKVLGASVSSVVALLSKDFLKLVLIALVLAAPPAYYFMDQWLESFSYRIDIQWWVFVLAGLAALTIAFLTMGFQSIKAALANPVDSLRSE